MTTKLQHLFSEVSDGTKKILDETAPFTHPLLTLMNTSLCEQKEILDQLIPHLEKEEEAKLSTIQEYISIVYHNFEIVSPLFGAWKRANNWMELSSKSVVEDIDHLLPKMKKNLEEAAMELEHIYGFEEVKFVVPTFYNPTIR